MPIRELFLLDRKVLSIRGCDKCYIHSHNKKYPSLRTDESFREPGNEHGNTSCSGTNTFNGWGSISIRMLQNIFFGNCPALHLSLQRKEELDEIYMTFRNNIPSEFERRPRQRRCIPGVRIAVAKFFCLKWALLSLLVVWAYYTKCEKNIFVKNCKILAK